MTRKENKRRPKGAMKLKNNEVQFNKRRLKNRIRDKMAKRSRKANRKT